MSADWTSAAICASTNGLKSTWTLLIKGHLVCKFASVANGRRWFQRVGRLPSGRYRAVNELLARSQRRALLRCALSGRLDGCPSRRDGQLHDVAFAGAACLQATAHSHGWPAASHTSAGTMPAAAGSVASTSATCRAAGMLASSACPRGVKGGPPAAVESAERRSSRFLGLCRARCTGLPRSCALDALVTLLTVLDRMSLNSTSGS